MQSIHRRLIWLFVAFGLALRTWHYAVGHTIWYDEAVLLANILGKGYGRLLGPLDHAVAAPPIFLWTLKFLSEAFHDNPYAYRAVPYLCSCATLLMTVPLVRGLFTPAVAVVAVGMVAVSDAHVWLGGTIKPYAGDALLATALILFFARTSAWPASRRLAVLAVAMPPIQCVSYPAAFIHGALLLALLPAAYRESKRGWAWWVVAAVAAAGTFAVLYFGPIHNQRVKGLLNEWDNYFPNLRDPMWLPWWLFEHTSTIFQYCFNPAGFYYCAVAPFGLIALWRSGRRDWVILLTAPFALSLAAAALKAWPYGDRLMFFIAPVTLLLGGFGMDAAVRQFPSKRLMVWGGTLLILIGLTIPVSRFCLPWQRPDSSTTAAYIRQHRRAGDRVATNEQAYDYFFHGELLSFEEAAQLPPGTRIWVPMDHYDQAERTQFTTYNLPPARFTIVETAVHRDSCAFLFIAR